MGKRRKASAESSRTRAYLLEFPIIQATVSIRVEHLERQLKLTLRDCRSRKSRQQGENHIKGTPRETLGQAIDVLANNVLKNMYSAYEIKPSPSASTKSKNDLAREGPP